MGRSEWRRIVVLRAGVLACFRGVDATRWSDQVAGLKAFERQFIHDSVVDEARLLQAKAIAESAGGFSAGASEGGTIRGGVPVHFAGKRVAVDGGFLGGF